jgi:hypothetical protein
MLMDPLTHGMAIVTRGRPSATALAVAWHYRNAWPDKAGG